ncbi:Uncharacterised protein [Porphyromonas cangingivalis]|uniref:Uncharacterized protein n=1 Tax=Porphyromonas cangingivalis TaxID=36874 RepID=A0A1T4LK54_PORCN|nr:hypothetical protein SAMN02745205_01154 [Porphyromonas cangingivalis]VEJ03012.1 Uncharacterised protein [Porphyromonas cangingivalis]
MKYSLELARVMAVYNHRQNETSIIFYFFFLQAISYKIHTKPLSQLLQK